MGTAVIFVVMCITAVALFDTFQVEASVKLNPVSLDEPVSAFDISSLFDVQSNVRHRHTKRSKKTDKNSKTGEQDWPIRKIAKVEGDLILGGLMMVHERNDEIICGPIMPQGGIQALEMMLFTLDYINNHANETFIPGVRIGARILDDCDKDTYGLDQAVEFIKGSIKNINDMPEYTCKDGGTPAVESVQTDVIVGVVGAPSSVTSIQVANLLRLFHIPQVSFFSTSPELSNKQRFEYFSRTVPSDTNQAMAMVEIVRRFNWTYVSIVYEDSNYGHNGFSKLEELLGKLEDPIVCIAEKKKLPKDSGKVMTGAEYDSMVDALKAKANARGVIIFGSDQEVSEFMKAVRRRKATRIFQWIGSDGWSSRSLVFNNKEEQVEGTLSIQPRARPVKGFASYFRNLTVFNNKRNPWFVEYWEHYFGCKFPNSTNTPWNQNHPKTCTGYEQYGKEIDFEAQLQFVSDAVLSFSYALRDMHRDLCGDMVGLCEEMEAPDGATLLKYLRKVEFQGLTGDYFKFAKDENGEEVGDGPKRYNVIHYRRFSNSSVFNKEFFDWVTVGTYEDGVLDLDLSKVQFKAYEPGIPRSVCSLPCNMGERKEFQEGDECCWICVNCTKYQILETETTCKTCHLGTLPNADKTICEPIHLEYLRYDAPWSISAMVFSTCGIFVTISVLSVFIKYNNTPIVKASGRELSFVLLCGILLCYIQTFLLVAKPSDIICTAAMFGVGFSFSICYAALLTKTNRIARIFNSGKRSAKRPSFISPRSQIIICLGLVSIQVAVSGIWIFWQRPTAEPYYPTRESNEWICSASKDATYMIVCAYPVCLMIVCTVYAVLTRKIPEAFNESKFIGFTMYTTCIIWLAFIPIYFSTASNLTVRLITMCIVISLSGTVSLICLFTPKLYIILLHPERNVRQSMMPNKPANSTHTTQKTLQTSVPPTSSCYRVDSGTQSDGSLSSISRSTSATQTISNYSENGITCSTQTLNSLGKFDPDSIGEGDVLL